MLVQMDETRIKTLEDIAHFLDGTTEACLVLQGSKDDAYAWIERTLVRFRFLCWAKSRKVLCCAISNGCRAIPGNM